MAEAERYFRVTIEYATLNGNPSTWQGDVFGTWETAHDLGELAARKARRSIGKITGGSLSAYAIGYVPSGVRK